VLLGVLLNMNGTSMYIKAYKFTLFEILGDIHVLSVCIIPDSMTYAVGGIYIRSIIFYPTSTVSASPTPTVIHNNNVFVTICF